MIKKNKKDDFKIQYYVRYPEQKTGELFYMPFKKINTNILSTEDEWKTIYYFRKEYIPLFEEEYFLNGSNYTFFIPFFSKSLLREKIQEFFTYMKIHKWIAGIRIGSHIKYNKHLFEIQVWSTISIENKDLIEKLKKIFEYKGKVRFQLFYPTPLLHHSDLTFVHQRNKKVYLLRFDYNLTREMYHKKEWWEIFMLSYFKKYYRPNSNVIDIGGNVGTHTLLLSEIISPKSKIYVFEPVYADIIKMNVDENHLEDHVIIYNEGIGSKNETLTVPIYPRNCVRNFGRLSLINHETELTTYLSPSLIKKCKTKMTPIKVVTLDSKGLTNISIIKIDVEGMELQVLEGAMETIQRERPVLFMEIWKRRRKQTFSNPIFKKILEELHYKPINIGGYEGHDYIFIPS
jgi:FkbM family methyltransferase